MKRVKVSVGDRELGLADLALPLPLDELVPGGPPWEVELGFGKGRYLLDRAGQEPAARLVGVEVAGKYYRLVRQRMRRRGLERVVLIRGEALYLMSAVLPAGFAAAVHVYFPDPWPKSRHQKRRLLDVETVDLVLALLAPGGRLFFATDHAEYGTLVEEVLGAHPGVAVRRRRRPWADGARTNYEAKYRLQARPIRRLEATRLAPAGADLLHPCGGCGVLAGSAA